ncbi:hypothetical protein GX51_01454 [Blastomyces parvus]|uniref:Uncharacterized protein n=1 Tax=Blastomyces parvus TaxID=2060905 RepID=A0A2B7X8L8_9EURO|nr:hypothetical protein GX51_01454 [Blastomyces parvus]
MARCDSLERQRDEETSQERENENVSKVDLWRSTEIGQQRARVTMELAAGHDRDGNWSGKATDGRFVVGDDVEAIAETRRG